MQPDNSTSQLYADNLAAKSCEVADAYKEGIMNEGISMNCVAASIRHSHSHYPSKNPQSNLADVTFQAIAVQSIQKGCGFATMTNQNANQHGNFPKRRLELVGTQKTPCPQIQPQPSHVGHDATPNLRRIFHVNALDVQINYYSHIHTKNVFSTAIFRKFALWSVLPSETLSSEMLIFEMGIILETGNFKLYKHAESR